MNFVNTNIERVDKMKNVTDMITEKDLLYIEDIFKWHQNSIKKLTIYLDLLEEDDSIKMLTTIIDMHETFCDDLVGFLEAE